MGYEAVSVVFLTAADRCRCRSGPGWCRTTAAVRPRGNVKRRVFSLACSTFLGIRVTEHMLRVPSMGSGRIHISVKVVYLDFFFVCFFSKAECA